MDRVRILDGVASGMDYMHSRRFLHRDIKVVVCWNVAITNVCVTYMFISHIAGEYIIIFRSLFIRCGGQDM